MGEPMPFKVGTILEGRYRIDAEVGRGGMGVVYRGIDLTLSRPVAIKAMLESRADAGVLARFMHEARSLASVEHEGLVPVYAVGQTDGVYYMVMKFVEGRPLSDVLLEDDRLDEASVCQMMSQVCRALSALHARGLVHRDLKPGNLMMGADGSCTVMDLGIVKQIDEASDAATSSTTGTPRYMPPEMFSNQSVDGRADLYSLGIIAYQALSGDVPFDGPTPMAILYKQAHTDAQPLRSVAPHVSRTMASLVHRLLAKDPTLRFSNADELEAALFDTQKSGGAEPKSFFFPMVAVALLGAVFWWVNQAPPTPEKQPKTDASIAHNQKAIKPSVGEQPTNQADVKSAVQVDAGRRNIIVDATRPPPKVDAAIPKVRLKIQSKPSRAGVYLGRRKIGTTPMILIRPQSARTMRFTLRRSDYRPVSFGVNLRRSQTVTKTLKPIIELLPQ